MHVVPFKKSRTMDAYALVRHCSLFADLSDDYLTMIAENTQHLVEPKGKILFLHGDEAQYCYLMLHGWIKLFRETLDGTEAVFDVVTKGHIFGQFAIFNHNIHDYTAQAIEAIGALLIPTSILQRLVAQDQRFALNMLHHMASHQRMQTDEIEHLALQSAPQRIGCFLLSLCKSARHTHPKESIELQLPYDKTLIASRLGMKAETFSRALAKLKEETGITIKGSTITVHGTDSLSIYSCANCSNQFPCT